MKEKKKKINKKNIILIVLIAVFAVFVVINLSEVIGWAIDGSKTSKLADELDEKAAIKEVSDNDNATIIETATAPNDMYFDYIKMNLIDVNFDELLAKNSDTKGWISVNGTNINYPFVQTSDNAYYLKHSFDKSANNAGWIFQDYRNTLLDNKNTILYGHGRVNGTMFGTLKNILSSDWVKDPNNFVVKISTLKENALYQVFSIYTIPETSDYIQTVFKSDDEFNTFVNMLKDRSGYNFNTNVTGSDKILTLSTCYNENDRVVLHAKLIKKVSK